MEAIEQFLPKQFSAKESEVEIKNIIFKTGSKSIKDLGKVIEVASKTLAKKSDGKSISEMANKLLS